MPLSKTELTEFMRHVPLAMIATTSSEGGPQAALVGVAVGENLECVFDTVDDSRKFLNVRRDGRVALVFGDAGTYTAGKHDERTLQYEGVAEFPTGADLQRARELYLRMFPHGKERLTWPHIAHVRVRPTWIRYSDYDQDPPVIAELADEDLSAWLKAES